MIHLLSKTSRASKTSFFWQELQHNMKYQQDFHCKCWMSFLLLFCSVFYTCTIKLKTHSYFIGFGCTGLSKKIFFQLHKSNNQNKHLAQLLYDGRFVNFSGSLAPSRYVLKERWPRNWLKYLMMFLSVPVSISQSVTKTHLTFNSTWKTNDLKRNSSLLKKRIQSHRYHVVSSNSGSFLCLPTLSAELFIYVFI